MYIKPLLFLFFFPSCFHCHRFQWFCIFAGQGVPGIIASLALTKTLCLDLWYQKGTPFWRTCQSIFYFCNGQGLKPRNPTTICFFSIFVHTWSTWYFPRWQRAEPRTLTYLFDVLESGFVCARYFRMTFIIFAKYHQEIYFRSIF